MNGGARLLAMKCLWYLWHFCPTCDNPCNCAPGHERRWACNHCEDNDKLRDKFIREATDARSG